MQKIQGLGAVPTLAASAGRYRREPRQGLRRPSVTAVSQGCVRRARPPAAPNSQSTTALMAAPAARLALTILFSLLVALVSHRFVRRPSSFPNFNPISTMVTATKAPVFFISHGGPPTMFQPEHPAYQHWREWGKQVRELHQQGVIRGLVFISAHWQAENLDQGVYGRSSATAQSITGARPHLVPDILLDLLICLRQ
ncbi:hypothetical protein L1887_43661 [Cichorium endivia]|nr:hypothetical protein L1887_43661 [Cichorium endivia]